MVSSRISDVQVMNVNHQRLQSQVWDVQAWGMAQVSYEFTMWGKKHPASSSYDQSGFNTQNIPENHVGISENTSEKCVMILYRI